MPTYQERERELATAVLADPTCTPEDRAAARSRLRSGSANDPYDVERLSDIEIDMCLYLHERARGASPEPIDAYSARDRAAAIQSWADELKLQADALAKGKAVPPSFVFRCKRCSDFSDEDLRCKRCSGFSDEDLQILVEVESELNEDEKV